MSAVMDEDKKKYRVYLAHSASPLFASDLKVLLHHLRREEIPCLTADDYLSGKKGALITLDDGNPNDVKIGYPILQEFDAHAVSFLIPLKNDLSPRVKDWDLWRQASDRIEVGSHSLTHGKVATKQADAEALPDDPNILVFQGMVGSDYQPALIAREFNPLCGRPETDGERRERLRAEIGFSKLFLERKLGRPVRLFSYPWGEYDDECVALVQETGYRAAFSITRTDDTLWTVPRVHLTPFAEELRRERTPLIGGNLVGSSVGRKP